MDSKKTFIRYISHEIRSPLSTTSLGLDYLIDRFSEGKAMSQEEIFDVIKDAKVCSDVAIFCMCLEFCGCLHEGILFSHFNTSFPL